MLYREIIVVCYKIYTKHINILFAENAYFLIPNMEVHAITIKL